MSKLSGLTVVDVGSENTVVEKTPTNINTSGLFRAVIKRLPVKLHYYRVGSDMNLYCVGCGLNIINPLVQGNYELIDSRPPRDNEYVCTSTSVVNQLRNVR